MNLYFLAGYSALYALSLWKLVKITVSENEELPDFIPKGAFVFVNMILCLSLIGLYYLVADWYLDWRSKRIVIRAQKLIAKVRAKYNLDENGNPIKDDETA